MATRTFTGGAASGVLTNTSNWDTYPTAGDDALINATSYNLTGDISAVNLGSLTVTKGWKGAKFGTEATPVTIQVNGAGRYANLDFGPTCRVANIAAGTAVTLARITSTGGATVVLSGSTAFTEVQGGPGGFIYADAPITTLHTCKSRITCGTNGTAITTAFVDENGLLDTERNVTTVYNDGKFINRNATTVGTLHNSGYWNPRSTGTVTTYYARSGSVLDPTGGIGQFTITTINDFVGAIVNLSGDGYSIAFGTYNPIGKTSR